MQWVAWTVEAMEVSKADKLVVLMATEMASLSAASQAVSMDTEMVFQMDMLMVDYLALL